MNNNYIRKVDTNKYIILIMILCFTVYVLCYRDAYFSTPLQNWIVGKVNWDVYSDGYGTVIGVRYFLIVIMIIYLSLRVNKFKNKKMIYLMKFFVKMFVFLYIIYILYDNFNVVNFFTLLILDNQDNVIILEFSIIYLYISIYIMLMFEISCLTYMNDIKNLLATCTRVLKENKIWFDTFLTFCISFGGLCVGISSCSIANSEKEANLRENDIADKEKQPNFLLESSTFDESDNLVLIVENKGNAYKSISISSLIYVIIPTNNESSFEKKVHRVQTKCSFDFNSHGFTYKDYEINKLKQIQEKKEYGGYIVEFKILYSDYKDENHEITIYSEQSKAFQIGNVPYSDDNKHSMRYVSTMDQFLIDFEEETNN